MNSRSVPPFSSTPAGLFYIPDFLDVVHEQEILKRIDELPFGKSMLGVYEAKRTVVHYTGHGYQNDYGETHSLEELPNWLIPLRERCAAILGCPAQEIKQVLVTRYDNAGIGWHGDRPQYGPTVLGLSLGGSNKMRFRRSGTRGEEQFQIMLAPRSLYIMSSEARSVWQHSMPETTELRYSVTFRTVLPNEKAQKIQIVSTPPGNRDDVTGGVAYIQKRLIALGLHDQVKSMSMPLGKKRQALESEEAVQLRLPL
jgi:DNA oxidative demethylase